MAAVPSFERLRRVVPSQRRYREAPSFVAASAIALAALAAAALVNRHLAKKAERDNPPTGQFLEVNGVRLHYVERGAGDPVVLSSGSGHPSMRACMPPPMLRHLVERSFFCRSLRALGAFDLSVAS
jgi:hypothetical protein